MSKAKFNLLVVAHPDDETIFFGGLLQKYRKYPWQVICVTDGNADGRGRLRKRQFMKACKALNVANAEMWTFPDVFEKRLDVSSLIQSLQEIHAPHEIFTHGILGEYGHPHHQDVCFSVHEAFREHSRLYSVAYNCYPEIRIELMAKTYETKTEILTEIYGSETMRFLNLLPATFSEGFLRVSNQEINALYDYFAKGSRLRTKDLRAYRWLISYIKQNRHYKRQF